MTDVVVVGAGPAGLAATQAALRAGADVTLVDAEPNLGGQYWRQSVLTTGLALSASGTDSELLHEIMNSPRCRVLSNTETWIAEGRDNRPRIGLLVGSDRSQRWISPDSVVIATGTHDATLAFPGWDLPGVLTAGAAQATVKATGVLPGTRVLISGAGPFLLPVANTLAIGGAQVVGVLEAARASSVLAAYGTRPWELFHTPEKVREAMSHAYLLARRRIPYRFGAGVIAAHGRSRVSSVTVADLDDEWNWRPNTERRVNVDAVCVTHGFTPRTELATALGCVLTESGYVLVNNDQATSVPNVYAAGEVTGIAGARSALAEGQIAGHLAAGGEPGLPEIPRARRSRTRQASFAVRIDRAHRPGPGWVKDLPPDTIICRCEETTRADLDAAVAQTDSTAAHGIKLISRAGLGPCQGRICGPTVTACLDQADPHRRDRARFSRRPIITPIRLDELASSLHGEEGTEHAD